MDLLSLAVVATLAGTPAPTLHCTGKGEPTVVLDTGASAIDWTRLQPLVALRHRACSYDATSADWPARLTAAGEKPPYVLVSATTAARRAKGVAGLVLIDPPDDAEPSAAATLAGPPFGDRPLVVLTRGTGATRRLVAAHARLAALSTRARHTVVAGAGHEIAVAEPNAVVDAVRDVVDGVNGKTFPRTPPASLVDAARETLSFPTEDGGVVCADVYGRGDRGIVLSHGGRFNKESWATQGRALAEAGFHVLALDLRGYGCSKGPGDADPSGAPLHFDVAAAVRYMRKAGAKTVSAVGGSMGGIPAAEVASRPGQIHRLVLLAATPGGPAEDLKAPALFIIAREDANDAGPRLPGLRAYYDKAPEPKELIVLEGSAHAQFLFETEHGTRVMREIVRFLSAP